MINKAILFATLAHEKQMRKGTQIPYILHPLEAGIITSQIKFDEDLICAAILHDTVEDSQVKYDTLKEMFNKRVADLVFAQSEDKTKGWQERKQHTIDFLKQVTDEDIKIVTLADKLSNIRSIHRDYEELKENLWQRFNMKDKNKHKWYYENLVENLRSLSKYDPYCEFVKLVNEVFK